MQVFAGTSGYSFRAWKGSFYPADLPAADMLTHYASRLGAVELNNTFYRMPRRSVVEAWAAAVPPAFRFAVKASRRITHQKRLRDVAEEVGFQLRQTAPLGERLGALLFQLPPQLRRDTALLEDFLELLPAGTPAALEFRHASWFVDEVYDVLAGRGLAVVTADEDGGTLAPVRTTDWGYLRLRRASYTEADLDRWAEAMQDLGWTHAFAFFKHEEPEIGPVLAASLAARF